MNVFKITWCRNRDGTLVTRWADSESLAENMCASQNMLDHGSNASWKKLDVPTSSKRDLVAWLTRQWGS